MMNNQETDYQRYREEFQSRLHAAGIVISYVFGFGGGLLFVVLAYSYTSIPVPVAVLIWMGICLLLYGFKLLLGSYIQMKRHQPVHQSPEPAGSLFPLTPVYMPGEGNKSVQPKCDDHHHPFYDELPSAMIIPNGDDMLD